MIRIVLTGFERFGELDVNPSQLIVQNIDAHARSAGIVTEVLPTEFAASGDRIRELIHQFKPDAVVCLGVAAGAHSITLERVALNLDDTGAPDNAGEIVAGRVIVPGGPLAYWSTLPLERIGKALKERGVPVSVSNHAGTYVCNHVFYVALHEINQLGRGTRCGFIHVPLMSEQAPASMASTSGLPLLTMVEGIECCLEVIQEAILNDTLAASRRLTCRKILALSTEKGTE